MLHLIDFDVIAIDRWWGFTRGAKDVIKIEFHSNSDPFNIHNSVNTSNQLLRRAAQFKNARTNILLLALCCVGGWVRRSKVLDGGSFMSLTRFIRCFSGERYWNGTNRSSAFGHGIEILVWCRRDRYTSSTFQYKEFDGFKRTPFNITMNTFSPCCHQRSMSSRRSDKWNNTQKNLGISFTGFSGMLPGRHIIIRHLPGLTWEGSLAFNTRII